jgi:deoxyribose-phosphate aldolase
MWGMTLDRSVVARMIDHTLLRPEATVADVEALCAEALNLGVFAVCVSPNMVPVAVESLEGSDIAVACVAGFPSGAHQWKVKVAEAELAVEQGAVEVDMVIDLGLAKGGRWDALTYEIEAVRAAVPAPALLKVIIESAVLTPEEIGEACRAGVAAGADFVKTSTGFHPAGGATSEAVRLMRATVGSGVGVKASGGIRTAEAAAAMIEAGASRIGCSASAAILDGFPATS